MHFDGFGTMLQAEFTASRKAHNGTPVQFCDITPRKALPLAAEFLAT